MLYHVLGCVGERAQLEMQQQDIETDPARNGALFQEGKKPTCTKKQLI